MTKGIRNMEKRKDGMWRDTKRDTKEYSERMEEGRGRRRIEEGRGRERIEEGRVWCLPACAK